MPHTFTHSELECVRDAIRLLVSPLDHSSLDEWRSRVNQHLSSFLKADSAGFLLPGAGGLAMYSDEHDPRALGAYPELLPPGLPDGTPLWEHFITKGVTTLESAYGDYYRTYLKCEYHNEFAAPNHAFGTLGLGIAVAGAGPPGMASLQFWHNRPNSPSFGERDEAVLRLLAPAFEAGVDMQLRFGTRRGEIASLFDVLGQAALFTDPSGPSVDESAALTAALRLDPDSALLRRELWSVLADLRATCGNTDLAPNLSRTVETGLATYSLCGSVVLTGGVKGLLFVVLERLTPVLRPSTELQERYGLTRAECAVAALLARKLRNGEIAQAMHISPHTCRRHTEAVLRKLGVPSRLDVGSRVLI